MFGAKHGGTFRPCVLYLIQKSENEALEHESPRRGGEMDQIYSVSEDLLEQNNTLLKQKKHQKACRKKHMTFSMFNKYPLNQQR